MLEHTASRFYQHALKTGLIDEAGLRAAWDAIPEEKRTPDAIDRRLARQTITSGHLTLWQAQQILSGRAGGFQIDKYLLLDLIGKGGMGRVYLARDVRLNRRVALKVLSQERMTNPRAITRFQREARVGAQLQHENLVRIYDEGDANGLRYLVMEYIEGKNIGQMIGEAGSIPWPLAARLGRQVALGLEHARVKGLIHRDVNPCNILVTADGTAKLTDMGLAIDLAEMDNVTRDGATVGTFDYVSPEQARHSRSVDTRADLYSLGCTLFHMISGRVPFPVSSLPEKLYAHQLHDPEPLHELVPGVPEGLSAVVARLMRKNPDERQPTPLVLAQDLEPYAVEGAGSPEGSTIIVSPPLRPARDEGQVADSGSTTIPAASDPSGAPGAPASWAATLGRTPRSGDEIGPGSALAPVRSDSFFPLDLGPEVPLSEGLRPAPKPGKSKTGTKSGVTGAVGPVRPPRRWLRPAGLAAGAVALSVMAGGGVWAARVLIPKVWGTHEPPPPPPPPPETGPIMVKGRNGQMVAAKTLAEAVARAARAQGEVILASAEPIRLGNKSPIIIPDGAPLTIRARDGVRPVLEIQLEGGEPVFSARASVRLVGLTVVLRRSAATPAPLIEADRDLALERCLVRCEGPADGSRAAVGRGSKTTLAHCLFAGFDRVLDVEAAAQSSVLVRQTIARTARRPDGPATALVRVLNAAGSAEPRPPGTPAASACQVKVESCSFAGAAFLDPAGFTAAAPLDIAVSDSAFQVRTLLALGSDKPAKAADLAPAVRWSGQGNQFQVEGPGWVALADGAAPVPEGPADLAAWSRWAREADAQAQTWKAPPESANAADPHANALVAEDGRTLGADPVQVGPR